MKTIILMLWAALMASALGLVAQEPLGKLEIRCLVGDVYVFTTYQAIGGNPFPSNGLYAVTPEGVLMIDTPWDTTQSQALLDSILVRHGQKVRICVATHFHDDRTGAFAHYAAQGIPTYSSRATWQLCQERGQQQAQHTFSADTAFHLGGLTCETFYPGPGHAPDNIVIWLPGARILYGGCLVKSVQSGTLGNLSDADAAQWPQAIRAVKTRFPHPRWIIPGHQGWQSRKALRHTLKLLKEYDTAKRRKQG